MWIDPTWVAKGIEALHETLDVDASLKRDMIQFLLDEGFWDPERLSWEAAVSRFNGCLNPHKAEFFKTAEVWALMKRFGRHELFAAMAEDLGYEVRRKPTEERRQALLERIADTTERAESQIRSARAELLRLEPPADDRPVTPLHATPRFSKAKPWEGNF